MVTCQKTATKLREWCFRWSESYWPLLPQFDRCLYVGRKRMADHLRRLRMQAKSAFGQLLKHIPVGLLGALFHRQLLHVPAPVPHLRCFHLSDLQQIGGELGKAG
jgi:hypothetical protein